MTDSRTDCIPSPQTLFRKETAKGEGEKEEERKGKISNSLSHRLFLASSGIVDASFPYLSFIVKAWVSQKNNS